MKKIVLSVLGFCLFIIAFSQTNPDWKKKRLDRAGDHLMVQLTYDMWGGAPDSIKSRIGGLSRGAGVSFMLDKPFKTDPHWSIAFGLGINASNIFFKKTSVDIKSNTTKLPFRNLDTLDHFKKYKLVTTFVEVPLELRYVLNPEKEDKSFKVAIGAKIGLLLDAHTKGKTLQNKAGTTINAYKIKEKENTFFNSSRIVATARVGLGHFSLVANYQITALIKDVAGPSIRPYQIGLCISGL